MSRTIEAVVHGASPCPGDEIPEAVVRVGISLDSVPGNDWPAAMQKDAQAIMDTFCACLPQGTLDRLTALLMQRVVTDIVRPHGLVGKAL